MPLSQRCLFAFQSNTDSRIRILLHATFLEEARVQFLRFYIMRSVKIMEPQSKPQSDPSSLRNRCSCIDRPGHLAFCHFLWAKHTKWLFTFSTRKNCIPSKFTEDLKLKMTWTHTSCGAPGFSTTLKNMRNLCWWLFGSFWLRDADSDETRYSFDLQHFGDHVRIALILTVCKVLGSR
jgi:hypothetical protein